MNSRHFALVAACTLLVVGAACSTRDEHLNVGPGDGGSIDWGLSVCAVGLVDCSGVCTTVATDSNNCGSCGNVCAAGATCAAGTCDCAAPRLTCGDLCIDPQSDAEHCGTCDHACGPTEICSAGECTVMCTGANHGVCMNVGEGGVREQVCVDLFSDSENCGTCNTHCSADSVCQGGICSCPGSETACSGMCVDTNTDPNNCGGCLASCGEGGTCAGGECTTCAPGRTPCGSPARCYDTETSSLHCGACGHSCEGASTCIGGACECPGSLIDCGTGCVDLTSNVRYCGDCETDCGEGGACAEGICTCASGYTMCGLECALLNNDRNHCGTCDVACAATEACIAGECVVAPLYHGWPSPIVGCLTDSYDTTAPTVLGGTYPYNATDSLACRAWKLAATVCTTEPTLYSTEANWTCPASGGFTDPVFGTYCATPSAQYACSTCPGSCNAGCVYEPLSLRDCAGDETMQM